MPKDADLARALADAISNQYTGKISDVPFKYDGYVDLTEMPEKAVAWIQLDNTPWTRESRNLWRRSTNLKVTSISRQGSTDDPQWIDDMLESFDMLMEFIGTDAVLGYKPTQIEQEERYNDEFFNTQKRLLQQAMVTYENI